MPLAPLPDGVVEFLKQPHAAVISTVRSDGAPYSAATWYDWDDGCILVSSTVRDILLGGHTHFSDRGEHSLQGFDQPWHLFALSE